MKRTCLLLITLCAVLFLSACSQGNEIKLAKKDSQKIIYTIQEIIHDHDSSAQFTVQRWYLASGKTSGMDSSIPRLLSPVMSFTPDKPRSFSQRRKDFQLSLSSFILGSI